MPKPATYYRPDIQRVVLAHNHLPKNAKLAGQAADRLEEAGFYVSVFQTKAGGSPKNAELIDRQLEPGDALGVVGGEGTCRDLIGALLLPQLDTLRKELFVTSMNQGGNACDIGAALHGRRTDPQKIFGSRMRAIEAFSLACNIETPEGDAIDAHALTYIGMGKTALGSKWVNSTLYKKAPRYLRDLGIVAGTLASDHTFSIGDRDGEVVQLSDLTVAKGPRMAKLARFPVRHWQATMWTSHVSAGRASTLGTAIKLPFGAADGFHHTAPLAFTAHSDILTHFDGEPPVVIPEASHVEIGLMPEAYNVLTTRFS